MNNFEVYNNDYMKLMCIARDDNYAFFLRLNDGVPVIGCHYRQSDSDNNISWEQGCYGAFRDYTDDKQYLNNMKNMIDYYFEKTNLKTDNEIIAERVDWLSLAHLTMISMNNEDAYDSWIIGGVPDECTEEDLENIAEDILEFEDVKRLFYRIIDRYKKYGIYKPPIRVLEFLRKENIDIEIV